MPLTCAPEKVRTCLHIPLIAFWVFMFIVAFTAQILSCFRRDTVRFSCTALLLVLTLQVTNYCGLYSSTIFLYTILKIAWSHFNHSSFDDSSQVIIECKDHVGSSFIITDIPIIFAYGLGVYLFSKEFHETEYLSNLTDKVYQELSASN